MNAMSMVDRATCLLVLLSGIPAAGKSSFADLLRVDEACRTCLSRCVRLTSVLRLDDFLAAATRAASTGDCPTARDAVVVDEGGGAAAPSAAPVFHPEAWHEAARTLYAAVREMLQRAHATTTTMPLVVLVEDNFHYYSMRERYWRLCREVDAAAQMCDSAPPSLRHTLLLELRFTVPLELCLRRNAARQGGPSGGEASYGGCDGARYVPPDVVYALYSRFDHCLAEGETPASGMDDAHGEPYRCWQVTTTTQSWTVLTLRPVPNEGKVAELRWPTVERECRDFVSLLADSSSPLCDALRSQHARRAAAIATMPSTHTDNIAAQRAACDTVVHQLDLELRASVRRFFVDVAHHKRQAAGAQQQPRLSSASPAVDMARLRKKVQRLKSNALELLREAVARETARQHGAGGEGACEAVMAHFYEALSQLQP